MSNLTAYKLLQSLVMLCRPRYTEDKFSDFDILPQPRMFVRTSSAFKIFMKTQEIN